MVSVVVKQIARWSGLGVGAGVTLNKLVSPYLHQLQRIKTDELISDERYGGAGGCSLLSFGGSIVRKFEQSLREGQARYGSEYAVFMGRIKVYFDIESISGLLSTCAPEEKDALWAEMKVLSTDGGVWGGGRG